MPNKIDDYHIAYFPAVRCNFNQGNLCSFTNGRNDDFDWTVHCGRTPSNHTGPSHDISGNGKLTDVFPNIKVKSNSYLKLI